MSKTLLCTPSVIEGVPEGGRKLGYEVLTHPSEIYTIQVVLVQTKQSRWDSYLLPQKQQDEENNIYQKYFCHALNC